jgi:hypothetical protein
MINCDTSINEIPDLVEGIIVSITDTGDAVMLRKP